MDAGVNLEIVAKTTGGFSLPTLRTFSMRLRCLAVRQGRRVIKMEDMEEAMIKVIAGPAKRAVLSLTRSAGSQPTSGHAIVMKNLEHHDPVHQISIIPRGAAGGMTISAQ